MNTYDSNCLIYPGEYVPLMNEKQMHEELSKLCKTDSRFPHVNVTEFDDSFKVEVAIPGVKRENFHVYADDNILSVCVVNKEPGLAEETFQLNEFNYDCFESHITLPDNADPEFVSAEYRSGILCLHMLKTKIPSKKHTRIVVY